MAKTSLSSTEQQTPKNADEVARAKDVMVPVWFANFFNTGVWSVIGLNTLTTTSALANLFLFPLPAASSALQGASSSWDLSSRTAYTVGLAAAVARYVFVPAVAGSVERLYGLCVRQARGEGVQEEEKGVAEASVREWVGRHKMRMGSVDLVAWVSFVMGVVGVFTP